MESEGEGHGGADEMWGVGEGATKVGGWRRTLTAESMAKKWKAAKQPWRRGREKEREQATMARPLEVERRGAGGRCRWRRVCPT